jgi:tRNA(Arg) A34 adenosine deaminase TadA
MDEAAAQRPLPPGPAPADDTRFMGEALAVAARALALGEPPVGACIVHEGRVLAAEHNGVIGSPDATAHAEILAIRAACRAVRAPRLEDCVLYATVEPCPMCLAACHYAGIRRVVYGASLDDMHRLTRDECFAPPPADLELAGPVRGDECRALLARWAGALPPGRLPGQP